MSLGAFNIYVPLINSFSANWSTSGLTTDNLFIDASSNQQYIKYSGQTDNSLNITGIALTANSSVATGYQTLTFPNGRGPTLCYVVYSATFAGLSQSANNIVTCWYSNYQTSGNNKSSVQFNVLLSAGPPSAPVSAPTFGAQTQNSNGISLNVTSAAPQFTDASNSIVAPGPPGIQAYKVNAFSLGDGTYRSPSAVAYPSTFFTSSTSTGIVALSQLYPDSSYNVYAQAQNNSSFTAYGPTGPVSILSATSLSAPAASAGTFSYTLPSPNTVTAKLVWANASGNTTNQSVTPVIIGTSPSPLTNSSSVTNAIQTLANRGKGLNGGTTSILDVSASVVRPVGVVAGFTQSIALAYNGFPAAPPTPATAAGYVSITPTTPADAYAAQVTALQGYYLTASNSVIISSSAFTSSNDKTTVTLTARQKTTGGTTSIATPYTYYYDASGNAAPTFTSTPTITMRNTNASYQVSGIFAIEGPVDLSCNTSIASNIGQYFYNNTQILSYGSSGTSETTTGNVTSSLTGGKFNYPVTFTNSAITNPQTNTFDTSMSLTVTAYSPTTFSTAGTAATISAIMDQPSYDLLTGSTVGYPASIQSMIFTSTAYVYGYRISSGTTPGPGGNTTTTTLPPASSTFVTTAYNNATSLVVDASMQDLQMANGQYQTKGTGTGSGYKNYTTYLYGPTQTNTLNYSTISATGYRYAQFSFNVTPSATTYTAIRFIVNGISQTVNLTGGLSPTVGSGPTALFFYYRIEQSSTYTSFSASYPNTTWINVGSNANPVLGATNYYNTTQVVNGGNIMSFSGTTLTINAQLFQLTVPTGTNDIYVYFRVAAPMNENFWFTNVQASFV